MKEIQVLKETMAHSEAERNNQTKSKEEEWSVKECKYVEEMKDIQSQIEKCMTEKSKMKNELNQAQLEIHALKQYKEQVKRYKQIESERRHKKTGKEHWKHVRLK